MERNEMEKRIQTRVDDAEGLTFGYIGNFERWGDDRRLFIWVDYLKETNGNTAHIWNCPANDLTIRAFSNALLAVQSFNTGCIYHAEKMIKRLSEVTTSENQS